MHDGFLGSGLGALIALAGCSNSNDANAHADAATPADAANAHDVEDDAAASGAWLLERVTDAPDALLDRRIVSIEFWNDTQGLIYARAPEQELACASSDASECISTFLVDDGDRFMEVAPPSESAPIRYFHVCAPRQSTPSAAYGIATFAATGGIAKLYRLELAAPEPAWSLEAELNLDELLPQGVVNAIACAGPDTVFVGGNDGNFTKAFIARHEAEGGWTHATFEETDGVGVFAIAANGVDHAWIGGAVDPALRGDATNPAIFGWSGDDVERPSLPQRPGAYAPLTILRSDGDGLSIGLYEFAQAYVRDGEQAWREETIPYLENGDVVASQDAEVIDGVAFVVVVNMDSCTTNIARRERSGAWDVIAEGHGTPSAPACGLAVLGMRSTTRGLLAGSAAHSATHEHPYELWRLARR